MRASVIYHGDNLDPRGTASVNYETRTESDWTAEDLSVNYQTRQESDGTTGDRRLEELHCGWTHRRFLDPSGHFR